MYSFDLYHCFIYFCCFDVVQHVQYTYFLKNNYEEKKNITVSFAFT